MITNEQTEQIVVKAHDAGFDCTVYDVQHFAEHGWVPPSVIGDDYDAALEEYLLRALDELGVEVR